MSEINNVLLKGNGKGDWFIIIDGTVALRFKPEMRWSDMMKVTKAIEDNIVGVHIKKKRP